MTLKADTVIIGAGPAGLTAAHELLRAGRGDILVLEATSDIGGISKTVAHNGNRIDIGGHRFFSKSDWVMNWWQDMLPVAEGEDPYFEIAYQGSRRGFAPSARASADANEVMLVRNRLSRIFFGGQFFDYPLKASIGTALKLGPVRCARFGGSYAYSMVFPRKPESTLEDFLVNRFGRQLYLQFFKDYTEKVWGVSCDQISADWGAQRIKGLSVGKALLHALAKPFRSQSAAAGQGTATSLIERFLYPKYGPGQMWEVAARKLQEAGVRILMQSQAVGMHRRDGRIASLSFEQRPSGERHTVECNNIVSTMPVRDLVNALGEEVPEDLRRIGGALQYRDFITVGLLYRKFRPRRESIDPVTHRVADNWIYIQEPGVRVGRLQIFNNWSPHMVRDPDTVWVGLEYFCLEDDDLWRMSDSQLVELGVKEMQKIGLADPGDALDGMALRMPKAYPGYYGDAYARFGELREWLDTLPNLYLVGRNGMHRYNNQDHSMLSARLAAEAIIAGSPDKSPIWGVNIDDEYHEEVRK
jgi:protoporphyrinogen oxidase